MILAVNMPARSRPTRTEASSLASPLWVPVVPLLRGPWFGGVAGPRHHPWVGFKRENGRGGFGKSAFVWTAFERGLLQRKINEVVADRGSGVNRRI